jgi:exopolysaccharide biosynthesis polyprenyl glycosylphosphotransferase
MTHSDAPGAGRSGAVRATALDRVAQRRALHAVLLLSDVAMLALAFAAAYSVRFSSGLPVFVTGVIGNADFYTRVIFTLIPMWLFIFWLLGLYNDHNLLGGTREYSLVFNGISAGMLVVIFGTFVKPEFVLARGWVLLSWVLGFLCVSVARFSLRRVVYALRSRGFFLAPALIVGTNAEAIALAGQLVTWRTSGLDVLGFVGITPWSGRIHGGLHQLGALDDLEDLVVGHGVTEIIIASSALNRIQLVDVFRRLGTRDDIEMRLSSGLFEVMTTGLEIKELAYVPLINVRPARLSGIDRFLKLALDYGIALPVAILGAPLFLLLALAVKLDSPGPVLHRRRVLGLGGREFDALKFRSMVADADGILADRPDLRRELADAEKLKDDPRVTRLGRILRKTSLDELPQVFNVLAGQMSIVGPRIITAAEHVRYAQWDMNLLTVKPGITGLWQVSGRSDIGYDERVQLDMNYIRNWTIWLDLQILMRTVPAVIRGKGAY